MAGVGAEAAAPAAAAAAPAGSSRRHTTSKMSVSPLPLRFSVVVPALNEGANVRRAVESAYNGATMHDAQHPPEVIVVDGRAWSLVL